MGKQIMAVVAHPDDLEWYAGGTACKLARDGAAITLIVCTNGDKGSYDPHADPHNLAAQRRLEQQNAAKLIGIRQVIFLDHSDGELEATVDFRKQLAALYREHHPEILLTFDPWKRYELHPDHIAVGRSAVDARITAKMPLFYPDLQINGWAIHELWLFNADVPNHFVDVSDSLQVQMRALSEHHSQSTVWDDAARQFIMNTARENGKSIGVEFAEAFRRIVIEGALIVAEGTKL